jgi:hypothetical protein
MQSNKGAYMRLGFSQFKSCSRASRLGCHRESGSKGFTQRDIGRVPKRRRPRSRNRSLSLNGQRAHNLWPLSLRSWWSYPEAMIRTSKFGGCSSSFPRQTQKRLASIYYSPSPRRSTHQRQTVLLVPSLQIRLAHSMKVLSTFHTLRAPRAQNTGGVVPFSVAWTVGSTCSCPAPSSHTSHTDIPNHTDVTVIGGSFAVRGVLSPAMFDALVSVLRIGTFTVLSLGLELVLLRDSGIQLRYPAAPPPAPQVTLVPIPPIAARMKRRSRPSMPGSGLWIFLTKTTENIIHRTRTISLDASSRPPKAVDGTQESGGDITPTAPLQRKDTLNTFSSIVEDVHRTKNLLSTSPGIDFPIPQLLQDIAEKEKRASTVGLTAGDETGLSSILGWTGRREDFLGPESFLRHQSITTIYSEHSFTRQKPNNEGSTEETLTSTACSPAQWRTYQYYARDWDNDQTLGELVKQTCEDADRSCVRPECKAKWNDHELRWVHHRAKVTGRVKPGGETKGACIWASCAVCGAATDRREMTEGTS